MLKDPLWVSQAAVRESNASIEKGASVEGSVIHGVTGGQGETSRVGSFSGLGRYPGFGEIETDRSGERLIAT